MPKGGFEPPLPEGNCALNAARLPVSPLRHQNAAGNQGTRQRVENIDSRSRKRKGIFGRLFLSADLLPSPISIPCCAKPPFPKYYRPGDERATIHTISIQHRRRDCGRRDRRTRLRLHPHSIDHPGHLVVSYINCSAEIKAMSDIICTSSNAVDIVNQIPENQPIIFAPDRNLGRYVSQQTGRELLLWQGSCIVHETFSERRIIELKVEHPEAAIIAHPECEAPVLHHADYIGSTTALLKYAKSSPKSTFIVATEPGIIHQMRKEASDKHFIPAPAQDNCNCSKRRITLLPACS